MEVKVSKKSKDFAKKNKMEIELCGEGVVHVYYYRGISNVTYLTAALVSSLKKDNPSLMVTALTIAVTSISSDGAIVNFEEKK